MIRTAGSTDADAESKDMNIVYRIQLKQDRTRGAYDVGHKLNIRPDIVQQMHDAHGDWNDAEHPTVSQDMGIKRYMEHDEYTGCISAADLLRWFRGFIPDLLQAGYEIVALHDVEITAVGEYQVLFKWKD